MWLKLFAPPLPKDRCAATEPEAEMNLSRQVLAVNLDAVPWHTRWTGESVDYTALATTIMAVCKEWGVLRMQDLKSKLGVLGMRWQMKVVSKVCRFLNARDAIRYVAAKLDNKVFNDCVQFNRDLSPKDWSIFLATGKRAGKPARTGESSNQDSNDATDSFMEPVASSKCLSVAPSWSADQPLAIAIAKSIMACGDTGLTNPDVYGLTLGVTDWMLQVDALPAGMGQRDGVNRSGKRPPYGFDQEVPTGASKLANLSQATFFQRKQRGRPRKIRPEYQSDRSGNDEVHHTPEAEVDPKTESQSGLNSMMVKLLVPGETLKKLLEPELEALNLQAADEDEDEDEDVGEDGFLTLSAINGGLGLPPMM
ncbi:hypothetical protein MKX07_006688 [Trichoderma sp. CBMAI-0711]|nr:hypothetical protein MKX07_006688 [Trichoderma sp. CBMAI-0711]